MKLDPEKIFEPDWVEIYKRRMEALHMQMSEISCIFFLYEKLARFPFDLFSPYPGAFWDLTKRSMFVSIIVGLWRVLYDNEKKALTVSKLTSDVITHAKDYAAKEHIIKLLREAQIGKRLKATRAEIKRIRHGYFAHLDVNHVDTPPKEAPRGVTLEELSHLLDEASKILNAIGLDTEYEFLLCDYHPDVIRPMGADTRSDIEKILDDMVHNCSDFHLPETDPYMFKFYWQHRSTAGKEAFNEYRKKFNLPEIPDNDNTCNQV